MEIFLIGIAFALGGILKGATGAGAPIIAIPILAIHNDVQFAIAVFAVPSLVPNLIQGWAFRTHHLGLNFVVSFALSGAAGAFFGTLFLANIASDVLLRTVAIAVLVYVGFRFLRPDWRLTLKRASAMSVPVGLISGVLQGISGVAAPVCVTFLNAMLLERSQFIATISVFFTALAAVQIPALVFFNLLTIERFWLSCIALIPLLAFMPVGAYLARRISKPHFDRIVQVLLTAIALRLIFESFT